MTLFPAPLPTPERVQQQPLGTGDQAEAEESLHPTAQLFQSPLSLKTSKNKIKTMKDLSDMKGAKIAFLFYVHTNERKVPVR